MTAHPPKLTTTTASTSDSDRYHIVVVVLGDLGRSPRMQYHVQSLLVAGHAVTFIGYDGEELIPALQHPSRRSVIIKEDLLHVIRFPAPKLAMLKEKQGAWLALYFCWRIVSLTLLLSIALFMRVKRRRIGCTPGVDALLVQNPPAVPLLAVAVLYGWIYHAAVIMDWHNLGYSMIPDTGAYGIYRQLAAWYERVLAPHAAGHFTVTKALKDFLQTDMGVAASDKNTLSVLLDCPPAHFRLRTIKEQHIMMSKLDDTLAKVCPASWMASRQAVGQTVLTEEFAINQYRPRANRPALVVSATSYTADEDIGLLITAMQMLDQRIQQSNSTLRVLCCITGKGPLKEMYQDQSAAIKWSDSVVVTTLWLEPSDYPTLLACADLGVSLHTSTSGMDLPIKILDYFGCEVPTCAYQFPCLTDLVQDDVNGRTFTTSAELETCLWQLLEPLAILQADPAVPQNHHIGNHDFGDLKRYSLQIQGHVLWSENWPRHAWPVLQHAILKHRAMKKQMSHAAATADDATEDNKKSQ